MHIRDPEEGHPHEALTQVNFLALETLESALEDSITCNAYMKAIKDSEHLFREKVVLHLTNGCFCLYSIFAAQAGAAKVYCVINGHGDL